MDELNNNPLKPIFKHWWFWAIIIVVIAGGVTAFFLSAGPLKQGKTENRPNAGVQTENQSNPSIRKCVEEAVGQERARAIKNGDTKATEEEQRKIDDCNKNFGGEKQVSSENNFYPDTDQAPVLELKWDGELNPSTTTRYTPFGVWEDWKEYPEGTAYEPAQEMQFYINTDKDAFLAVAPGIVVDNRVDSTKSSGIGLITVRYGKYYSVTYYHIIPDSNLKVGDKVELGDQLGRMEKRQHPEWGEETWWEIGLQKYDQEDKKVYTVNPYEYFNDAGKAKLNQIANASKESSAHWKTADGGRGWIIIGGCSFVPYTGGQEWWSSIDRLGYTPEGAVDQNEEDFVKSINSNWKSGDNEGRIIGPTDKCK